MLVSYRYDNPILIVMFFWVENDAFCGSVYCSQFITLHFLCDFPSSQRTFTLLQVSSAHIFIGKDPAAGKDWGQEKGVTEDEMVGWHHQHNGHETEPAAGDGEGQGSLALQSMGSPRDRNDWVTEQVPTRRLWFSPKKKKNPTWLKKKS